MAHTPEHTSIFSAVMLLHMLQLPFQYSCLCPYHLTRQKTPVKLAAGDM